MISSCSDISATELPRINFMSPDRCIAPNSIATPVSLDCPHGTSTAEGKYLQNFLE